MKQYIIYKHTNLKNGKVYIGQTSYSNPEKRWGKLGQKYYTCTYFYHAIQKYGWDNFKHEILEQNLTANEANIKEKYYIELYKSNQQEFGYNLTTGGEQGKKLSAFSRKKMSDAKKNKPLSEEHRQKISDQMKKNNPMQGKHLSEETKNKIRNKKYKPIKCLETGVIYKNREEAAKTVGLKSPRSISEALRDSWRTAGKNKETGVKYHWIHINSEVRE